MCDGERRVMYTAYSELGMETADMRLLEWLLSWWATGTEARMFRSGVDIMRAAGPMVLSLLARDLDFIDRMDLGTIHEDDPGFPDALRCDAGRRGPGLLLYKGARRLLDTPGIMVCGARDASHHACDIAYRCGRLIAEQGYVVMSGYARGIDRAAHRGALEAGGDTLAFVPYGLERFRVHSELADVFDEERVLVMSEVAPSYGFSRRNALRRNRLLVGLSRAVIVVEPGETGGSWYTARHAATAGRPLFFCEGARYDIMPELEAMGGERVRIMRGAPDLRPVYEAAETRGRVA